MTEMRRRVLAGQAVVLLVDELEMHGEACPHWVAVTGFEDGVFLIEDPWTDEEFGESWVDSHALAVRPESLERLAHTGAPAFQALLAVQAARPPSAAR
jgi:hypothetical protein